MRELALASRRLACLDRYVEEHEEAADGEQALLATIRAGVDLAGGLWGPCYRGLAGGIREHADRFLAQHAGSKHEAEIRTYRALAAMYGTFDRAHDFWKDPPRPPSCEAALPELEALAAGDPADPWTRRALAYQAVCLFERGADDPGPAREASRTFLDLPEPQAEQRHSLDYRVRSLVRALGFRLDGAPEFAARTVDGREVSLASFKGQLLLLDFWGPG